MLRKLSLFLVLGSFLTTLGCGIPDIAGIVTEDGEGHEGVTVTLTGPTSQSTITDSDGTYSFPDLELGSYTVTPSLDLYRFVPEHTTVDVTYAFLGVPLDGIDFVAESGPDLIVSTLAMTEVIPGYIEYDYTIKNIGTTPVDLGPSGPAVAVQAVLSNDEIFNNDDDEWACGKRLTGVLNPGETLPGSYHCDVDAYSFTYLILMIDFDIDGTDLIEELDETNNTTVAQVFPSTELIPASLLTVAQGESVTYAGINPADGISIMTLTFHGDGTLEKNWTIPVFGNIDCIGTWAYDGTQMTLNHSNVPGGQLVTTEVYEALFTYDDGNKMSYTSPIQDIPGDGSLFVGEYSLDSDVHTVFSPIIDMTVDVEAITTISQDGTWSTVTTSVYVGDITHTPPDYTDVQTTEGTWSFADNWLFELDGEYIVRVDDSMVLTRQP